MRISGVNDGGDAVQQRTLPSLDVTAPAEGLANIGRALSGAGADAFSVQARINEENKIKAHEKKTKNQELQRAKAANGMLDHELYVKQSVATLQDSVSKGETAYQDAPKLYDDIITKAPVFEVDKTDPVLMENYTKHIKRINFSGQVDVEKTIDIAKQADYNNQFSSGLDKLGKIAGLPGSDLEAVNKQAESLKLLGRNGGLKEDELNKKIQDFKDNNWFNQASQFSLQYSNDMKSLQDLKRELTAKDGFYADKLDANKRTAIMRTVDASILTLTNRDQHMQDKREAVAEHTINTIDSQIAKGVPATPQMWADWQDKVKGTPSEADFKQRIGDELEVQDVLKKPIEQQMAYLQQKTQSLSTKGGSLRDDANLNRLKTAIDLNIKTLQETPLVFNQNHSGITTPPLDLTAAASNPKALTDQLKDRFSTVSALRKRYGNQVSNNPFLPQEIEPLKAVIDKADDKSKLAILGVIAQSSPDANAYGAALKTISADKGALMLAGMAHYRGFKSIEGRNVAETILKGEKILADKSVIMPNESVFKTAFDEKVGDSIADGSPQRQQAFLAFKTLYAGLANDMGKRHVAEDKAVPFDNVVSVAISLATGGITDYNDKKVIMPYGMKDEDFTKKVAEGIKFVAKQSGYAEENLQDFPIYPVPGKDGYYYLLHGNKPQLDKKGAPLMVNVK